MRFSFILSIVLGTALCRPAADGFFPEFFPSSHPKATGSKLSAQDLAYIQKQLDDPYKFRSLMLEDTVAFDIDNLSIPEAEVSKFLIEDAKHNKETTNMAFAQLVLDRTELPTPVQARARIASLVQVLSSMENFDQQLLEGARTLFIVNPNFAKNVNTMAIHLGGPFDDSLVKLTGTFFSVANQENMPASTKMQALMNQIQSEFKLFPEDTFRRIQESYTAKF